MKKRAARFIFVAILIIILLLIWGTILRKSKADEAMERIMSLPDLVLTDIDGEIFRTNQIVTGPLLIIYFHPECDYCRYEIGSVLSSILACSDLKILLVSHADRDSIEVLMEQFDIDKYSELHVLQDTALTFSEVFGTDVIPTNFIYNKDLRLIKAIKGEIKVETILKYLSCSDKY